MKRPEWKETQEENNSERFVFPHEKILETDLTRIQGCAISGDRLLEAIPGERGAIHPFLQAIALDRAQVARVLDGLLVNIRFARLWEQLLAPALHPGDLVVRDHLSRDESAKAIQAIVAIGARLAYVPPDSLDLNLIKNLFSKLKQLIKVSSTTETPTNRFHFCQDNHANHHRRHRGNVQSRWTRGNEKE